MNQVQAIIDSIRAAAIPHHQFEVTYRRFSSAVKLADESTVVALVGPTRVGKTTLIRRLMAELTDPNLDESFMPVLMIEAATTDSGFMSTKHLMQQCLVVIRHPFHLDESYRGHHSTGESALNLRLVGGSVLRCIAS